MDEVDDHDWAQCGPVLAFSRRWAPVFATPIFLAVATNIHWFLFPLAPWQVLSGVSMWAVGLYFFLSENKDHPWYLGPMPRHRWNQNLWLCFVLCSGIGLIGSVALLSSDTVSAAVTAPTVYFLFSAHALIPARLKPKCCRDGFCRLEWGTRCRYIGWAVTTVLLLASAIWASVIEGNCGEAEDLSSDLGRWSAWQDRQFFLNDWGARFRGEYCHCAGGYAAPSYSANEWIFKGNEESCFCTQDNWLGIIDTAYCLRVCNTTGNNGQPGACTCSPQIGADREAIARRCADWANATGNNVCRGPRTYCVNVCKNVGTVDVGSSLCTPGIPVVIVWVLSLLWMAIAARQGCAKDCAKDGAKDDDPLLEDTAMLPGE